MELKTQHSQLKSQRDAAKIQQGETGLNSAVLDTIGALVVVLDREGCIVGFNRTCQQTTGFVLDEVKGKCIWDLFLVPEEMEPVKAVFEELRNGQFPNKYENYWVNKDGSRRRIAWSNTALVDDKGKVEYVIGTGIDITERKRVEKEIAVRNWRF
jgi:PAS domain S-box-containing protein